MGSIIWGVCRSRKRKIKSTIERLIVRRTSNVEACMRRITTLYISCISINIFKIRLQRAAL